jgi:hypothetical protein
MVSQTVTVSQSSGDSRFSSQNGRWTRYLNSLLAREVSGLTRYYDRVIQWLPRENDSGQLLREVEVKIKQTIDGEDCFPNLAAESGSRTAVLINGALNHHFDVQGLLSALKPKLSRTSRLLLVLYNPYFRWLYLLANRLGLRKGEVPTTFLRRIDLENLAKISGFEIVSEKPIVYCPFRLLGVGNILNRALALIPILRWMSLAYLSVWRPVVASAAVGLSCVIPARNERGNIENALRRFPRLGCDVEIIFVEGHSNDGTWQEILRVAEAYRGQFQIKTFQQTGKGKGDAVRLGFAHATQALVTILDADLTMPPEMLRRFYDAYVAGMGDFINGSRLVYPMEGEAMRPLNRLGNMFFAKALSWVLRTRLGDSLCGTKLLARHDYQRFIQWREDFGDFDPFGDFELLFPASILGLGIVEIPVRYLARTYGTTNIQRFRQGLQLINMTLLGFVHITLGFGRQIKRPKTTEAELPS